MARFQIPAQHARFLHYKRCHHNMLPNIRAALHAKIDSMLSVSNKHSKVKDIVVSQRRLSDYACFLTDRAQGSLDAFAETCDGFENVFEFAMLKISLPCNILDRALENGSNGFRNASWTSVFFSSTPVSALLWKFQTIIIFSLVVFALMGLFVVQRSNNQSMNLFSMKAVLFKTVKTRNGTDGSLLQTPSVTDLLLFRRGCPVNLTSAKLWLQGAEAVIYSTEMLRFNAVRFRNRVEEGTDWIDPATFQVYGMEDAFDPSQPSTSGKDWKLIGASASNFLQFQCGESAVRGSRNFLTSARRGGFSELDLRASWHYNLLQYGCYIPLIFAYLITIFARLCNLMPLSQTFFSICTMGPGFFILVVCVGLWIEGRDYYHANFDLFIQGILWIVLGLLASVKQKWFLSFIPILWSTIVVLSLAQSVAVCRQLHFFLQPDPFAFLCVYVFITLARHITHFISHKKIANDLQAYETEWKLITETNLVDLQSKLKTHESSFTGEVIQHSDEVCMGEDFENLDSMLSEASLESVCSDVTIAVMSPLEVKSAPVRSLDQLYAQAVLVYPLFLRKVQHIALLAGGSFAVKGEDGAASYISWREAAGRPEEERKI
eukprot:767052-Hanusia_phi.AAC.1